jgi:hypothetical protein
LQQLAPAGTLGRVTGVISTAESATETASMPLAGALLAGAGIRPGALALAAVAVAAGQRALRGGLRTPDVTAGSPKVGYTS